MVWVWVARCFDINNMVNMAYHHGIRTSVFFIRELLIRLAKSWGKRFSLGGEMTYFGVVSG